jgi:hypothetical protein
MTLTVAMFGIQCDPTNSHVQFLTGEFLNFRLSTYSSGYYGYDELSHLSTSLIASECRVRSWNSNAFSLPNAMVSLAGYS